MKKFLLTLFLLLFTSPLLAQNYTNVDLDGTSTGFGRSFVASHTVISVIGERVCLGTGPVASVTFSPPLSWIVAEQAKTAVYIGNSVVTYSTNGVVIFSSSQVTTLPLTNLKNLYLTGPRGTYINWFKIVP